MKHEVIQVGQNFWNLRGSFRVGGLVNVGTHVSLVKCANGKFVFLDAYTLSPSVQREIADITGGPDAIDAIVNLHPFHTVHVEKMHEQYPKASLYGTQRHLELFPDLPWEKIRTEDVELQGLFSDDLEFSIPRGVDFISSNEHVHFSSVLAFHRSSKTIHVDDTFMFVQLPGLMRFFGLKDSTNFHMTLSKALEKRPGAASDFKDWAEEIIEQWKDVKNLCAAHTSTLLDEENHSDPIHTRLLRALDKVTPVLDSHEKKHG